jgi:DNA-binding MarR family transcriptional regulator
MSQLQQELKQSQPFGSVAVEAFLNLVRTAELARGAEQDLLDRFDLSAPQYNVLRILRGAGPEGHPCQEIGARMVTRVPDVTRLVDRLAGRGLVERRRCERDRRVVFVRILPPGLELLARIDAPIRALPERLFAQLSAAQLAQFNELLVLARRDCEPS